MLPFIVILMTPTFISLLNWMCLHKDVKNWSTQNLLTLHEKKTKIIVFGIHTTMDEWTHTRRLIIIIPPLLEIFKWFLKALLN